MSASWYDSIEIRLGADFRRAREKGLPESCFVLVVIKPSFWTHTGLFRRELDDFLFRGLDLGCRLQQVARRTFAWRDVTRRDNNVWRATELRLALLVHALHRREAMMSPHNARALLDAVASRQVPECPGSQLRCTHSVSAYSGRLDHSFRAHSITDSAHSITGWEAQRRGGLLCASTRRPRRATTRSLRKPAPLEAVA